MRGSPFRGGPRIIVGGLWLAMLWGVPDLSSVGATSASRQVAPTLADIDTLVRGEWRYFANRIQQQEALAAPPRQMIAVSQTRCTTGYDGGFFTCATHIVYALPNGEPRSARIEHDVERDDAARWQNAIVAREWHPRR